MSNRILDVRAEDRSLDPVSAEVRIILRPERLTPATEVRGRLLGPSCPYANTVEIAYPLRPVRAEEQEPGTLTCRVVIPEASLWDSQSPFLYAGPVELWQDGQCIDRLHVRHGLRAFQVTPYGLRVNGKITPLDGRRVETLTEGQALQLREQGCNLLVAPLREDAAPVWEMADRFGFLVLGEVGSESAPHQEMLERLSRRPSSLGWLGAGATQAVQFELRREGHVMSLHAGTALLGRLPLPGS